MCIWNDVDLLNESSISSRWLCLRGESAATFSIHTTSPHHFIRFLPTIPTTHSLHPQLQPILLLQWFVHIKLAGKLQDLLWSWKAASLSHPHTGQVEAATSPMIYALVHQLINKNLYILLLAKYVIRHCHSWSNTIYYDTCSSLINSLINGHYIQHSFTQLVQSLHSHHWRS